MTFLRSTEGKPRKDTHKNEIFKHNVGITNLLIQLRQFSHVKMGRPGILRRALILEGKRTMR
jgi:hypothetical protein